MTIINGKNHYQETKEAHQIHFNKVNGLGFICGYCLRATEMGKNLASVDVRVAIGGNCTLLLYSSGDMILAVTYMK